MKDNNPRPLAGLYFNMNTKLKLTIAAIGGIVAVLLGLYSYCSKLIP